MKLRPIIILLPFLGFSLNAYAQMPEEATASSMPEWEMSLETIKSKAQTLMLQNNGLQDQYRQLLGQQQQLEQAIRDQQNKNEQMQRFLKERHGETDQQIRIQQLTESIKTKKLELRTLRQQEQDLGKKQIGLERNLRRLNATISHVQLHQEQKPKIQTPSAVARTPVGDEQLVPWRKELEYQTTQEAVLGRELEALKTGGKTKNANLDAIAQENKELGNRLDLLRLQKMQYMKNSSGTTSAQGRQQKYDELKMRKEELETDISVYEARLGDLRESSLTGLSWPLKKKKLVHQMVQADARNNQMREDIKALREDIGILKEQVARLERRLDFAKGQSLPL